MSLVTTPSPARSDDPRPAGPLQRAVVGTRSVRAAGIAVATGSTAWAAGILAFGLDPVDGWQGHVYDLSTLLFQLGLVALVGVQLRTRATGTGRLARAFLHAEHLLLGMAVVATVSWALVPDAEDVPLLLALDAFWPLSMLGMFAIGIRIAIAGRWQGAARWWPLGAESWAPVVIPVNVLLGAAAGYVAAAHLLVGYAALGVLLARRPELTGARD